MSKQSLIKQILELPALQHAASQDAAMTAALRSLSAQELRKVKEKLGG